MGKSSFYVVWDVLIYVVETSNQPIFMLVCGILVMMDQSSVKNREGIMSWEMSLTSAVKRVLWTGFS